MLNRLSMWGVAQVVASSDASSVNQSSQFRLVRSIRLARALRGVRVVRLFRYVSALRHGWIMGWHGLQIDLD